jgi:hypothetical protein
MVAALGVGIAAEQRGEVALVRQPTQSVRFSAPWVPSGSSTETRVVGTVIDIRQVPVSNARVQLRDLKTGSVIQTGETSPVGEYAFTLLEPGTYVVEMVMADNYVVALSNAGSLRRYETLNTVVQLPGRWDYNTRSVIGIVNASSFFGMGSLNTMTANTLTMAVDSEIKPADVEPVSPQ